MRATVKGTPATRKLCRRNKGGKQHSHHSQGQYRQAAAADLFDVEVERCLEHERGDKDEKDETADRDQSARAAG